MLATDYALTRPAGIVSLILASPPLSIPRWLADAAVYRAELPAEVRATLDQHEAAGTTDSVEYQAATMVYYQRHVCRLDPWPEPLLRAVAGLGAPVYHAMWGPNEFYMTGNLKTYDRSDRLSEIAVPTLFTCGRYDEAPPATTIWYQGLVPGAELAVFEASSHTPHLEEPAAYLEAVRAFLRQVETDQT
jgi:proline iminopeptidase